MDAAVIYSKELLNDGSFIYIYKNEQQNVWCAYGYSAYALRLFCKTYEHSSIRAYSQPMQLPCTVVDNDAIVLIIQNSAEIKEQTDTCIGAQMREQINFDAYKKWVDKLKGGTSNDSDLIISTRVSKYVPKNKFIADGMSSFSRNVKRIGDCFLALVALIVFSPVSLVCYIAVKREDGGPAIFKQERIGRFGRPFFIYKFRTMRLDSEKFGPQLSHSGGDGDPRLTKVGRFLRQHHLDELPQLWNVFRGDMAFIGPRPERKFYIDQIMEYDIRYTYLYQIRPGVTSYATLYNGYTDTMEKMLRRLEYDLYYLGHRSWWFDFKILFNTFCSIVFGKKF